LLSTTAANRFDSTGILPGDDDGDSPVPRPRPACDRTGDEVEGVLGGWTGRGREARVVLSDAGRSGVVTDFPSTVSLAALEYSYLPLPQAVN
jgi:hypothetical protein